MCLACLVIKFDFWQPHLRGTPILVPPIVSNFMFLLHLLTLKTSCVQLLRLNSLSFRGLRLGVTPYFGTHNFCFIFDIYPPRKFDLSNFNGLKVQNFGGLV